MISNGISRITEPDDVAIYYKAHCACGGDDCIHTIHLEVSSEDYPELSMTLYSNVSYDYWNEKDDYYYPGEISLWESFQHRLSNLGRRIKFSWKLITTGYIKQQSSFLFSTEEQITDYIKALQEGIKLKKRLIKKKESDDRKKAKKRD